jgi:hypothetical protein
MSVYNDEDGETVDVPGDSDTGDVVTETHPDIDGWSELSDTKQEIIITAADPAKEWGSCADLAGAVGVSRSYVTETLNEHTPELHQSVKRKTQSQERYNAEFTDQVREKLLSGASVSSVKRAFDCTAETVRRHAREKMHADDTTHPQLRYEYDHTGNQGEWKPVDDATAQSEFGDVTESAADDDNTHDTNNSDGTDTNINARSTDITSERIDEIRREAVDGNSSSHRDHDDLTPQQYKYYLKTSDNQHNPSEPPLTYNRSERKWVRVTNAACTVCREFYETYGWEFCPQCGSRLLRWSDMNTDTDSDSDSEDG